MENAIVSMPFFYLASHTLKGHKTPTKFIEADVGNFIVPILSEDEFPLVAEAAIPTLAPSSASELQTYRADYRHPLELARDIEMLRVDIRKTADGQLMAPVLMGADEPGEEMANLVTAATLSGSQIRRHVVDNGLQIGNVLTSIGRPLKVKNSAEVSRLIISSMSEFEDEDKRKYEDLVRSMISGKQFRYHNYMFPQFGLGEIKRENQNVIANVFSGPKDECIVFSADDPRLANYSKRHDDNRGSAINAMQDIVSQTYRVYNGVLYCLAPALVWDNTLRGYNSSPGPEKDIVMPIVYQRFHHLNSRKTTDDADNVEDGKVLDSKGALNAFFKTYDDAYAYVADAVRTDNGVLSEPLEPIDPSSDELLEAVKNCRRLLNYAGHREFYEHTISFRETANCVIFQDTSDIKARFVDFTLYDPEFKIKPDNCRPSNGLRSIISAKREIFWRDFCDIMDGIYSNTSVTDVDLEFLNKLYSIKKNLNIKNSSQGIIIDNPEDRLEFMTNFINNVIRIRHSIDDIAELNPGQISVRDLYKLADEIMDLAAFDPVSNFHEPNRNGLYKKIDDMFLRGVLTNEPGILNSKTSEPARRPSEMKK